VREYIQSQGGFHIGRFSTRASVSPGDRRTHRIEVVVAQHQPMHLSTEPDPGNRIQVDRRSNLLGRSPRGRKPLTRIGLGPSRPR
jgi:hypothetical protein